MRRSKLLDDGSGEVVAVELTQDGVTAQSLWVGVGPVYWSDNENSGSGIWISYQPAYMDSKLEGPVLLDFRTWKELNRAVRRRQFRSKKIIRRIMKLEGKIDVAFHNAGRRQR